MEFFHITVERTFNSQNHRMVWKGQGLFNEHLAPTPLLWAWTSSYRSDGAQSSIQPDTSTAQATALLLPLAVLLLQDLRMNRRTTAAQKPTTHRDSL